LKWFVLKTGFDVHHLESKLVASVLTAVDDIE
jgi:hypothetical protein